jgi:hypothetical protein
VANQFSISTHAVTVVANTAKTLVEIPTGATVPATILGFEIMSAATAAGSMVLEYGTFTTTGTGTTVTPQKWGTDQSVAAIMGTCKIANTAEPSGFAVGTRPSWTIPLPGMYSILFPYGRELYQPISTNCAWRITSTQASPVRLNIVFEQ